MKMIGVFLHIPFKILQNNNNNPAMYTVCKMYIKADYRGHFCSWFTPENDHFFPPAMLVVVGVEDTRLSTTLYLGVHAVLLISVQVMWPN